MPNARVSLRLKKVGPKFSDNDESITFAMADDESELINEVKSSK